MKRKFYKILFLILGILTLLWMIYRIGPHTIWDNMLQVGWWFVPILLSWFVIYLMNAVAFRHIIVEAQRPETRLSFSTIMQLTVSGYSINYVTPFVALGGEPYRIMALTPALGQAKASSSVLLYGMVHILSHIIFWLISVFLILAFVPLGKLMVLTCCCIVILGLVVCWWFSRIYRSGLVVSVLGFLTKLPFLGKYFSKLIAHNKAVFEDIDIQIKDLFDNRKRNFYTALSWEFLARVVGCAELYFISIALGLNMDVIQAFIVSSGSSLFANLIFFLPMQLGTREGGLAMALVSIGFPASVGVIMGLATRIREIVWIGIGLVWMSIVRK
ncbi:lysylphosphatidylglycerol synthase transmembrane domain-containing protein [Sphingobacterium sp. SG20118]|uniref:lysylphosphatidylglycerol synthase transmembrane domain-containing protein n=1 Tax=Sphingobacterium sp. SG20118 TaxID=3367156 RepID=UPI0037DFC5D7